MTNETTYGFDTLQIHAGARPDPATGLGKHQSISRQRLCFEMPITQPLCLTCKKLAIFTRD